MQPTDDSQSSRDELFRPIGRNVAYFQYLEATLRSLIPVLSNKGTLQELQANQDEVTRKHEKSTLGNLTTAYHEEVFGKNATEEVVPGKDLDNVWFAFSSQPQVDAETAEQWKAALVNLVGERNRLIHEDLLNVDLNSREDGEELSARLDEQYIRIRRWLDYLNSLRIRHREMTAEFKRRLESKEFITLLMDPPES